MPLRRVRYERLQKIFIKLICQEKKTAQTEQKREKQRRQTGGGEERGRGETEETIEVQKEEEIICTQSRTGTPTNEVHDAQPCVSTAVLKFS